MVPQRRQISAASGPGDVVSTVAQPPLSGQMFERAFRSTEQLSARTAARHCSALARAVAGSHVHEPSSRAVRVCAASMHDAG